MLLVCKMLHGSLSRAVHGICIVLSCIIPCGSQTFYSCSAFICKGYAIYCVNPRLPYHGLTPISKELVFSPHGEQMKSHPGVAAHRALPLKWPTVSVTHDTRCSTDAGWACYEAMAAW